LSCIEVPEAGETNTERSKRARRVSRHLGRGDRALVNLFLIRWSPNGATDSPDEAAALESLLSELGSPGIRVQEWSAPSGALRLVHAALPAAGGERYVHYDERRMALFAGRPIQWNGEFDADGRRPLDARLHLEPSGWDGLDGRYAAARYDNGVLEVRTDAMGAYPLYAATARASRWISNSAELLRRVSGSSESDPLVLASLIAGGWSLSGHPRWAGVRRLPRGVIARFERPGEPTFTEVLPTSRMAEMFGSGFDAEAAARTLVAGVRALADCPGRRSVVPLTGGRDSRLVLAAALRAGIDFEAFTYGREGDLEVRIAKRLCEVAGVSHSVVQHPGLSDALDAPERLRLVAPGLASIEDSSARDRGAPPALWHSGQGGEIARSYFGRGPDAGAMSFDALAHRLYAEHFTGLGPRPDDILSEDARRLLTSYLDDWAREQVDAGVSPPDVPDAFYLLQRLAHWASSRQGHAEYHWETTSPLWHAQLLPHMLGVSPRGRSGELFHLSLLRSLGPELLEVRFVRPWAALESPRRRALRRARRLAGKVRRRLPARVGDAVARPMLGPAYRPAAHTALFDSRLFADLLGKVRE
jgi:hypothetical protein